jgi:hypothetical protein
MEEVLEVLLRGLIPAVLVEILRGRYNKFVHKARAQALNHSQ